MTSRSKAEERAVRVYRVTYEKVRQFASAVLTVCTRVCVSTKEQLKDQRCCQGSLEDSNQGSIQARLVVPGTLPFAIRDCATSEARDGHHIHES